MSPQKQTQNKKTSVFNGNISAKDDNETFIIEGENSKLIVIREIL
jgi:hypothetical protein